MLRIGGGMAIQWKGYLKAKGVRFYEHDERLARPNSRQKDRYWQLVYKYEGKTKTESLGWESEGWEELTVSELAIKLAKNRKNRVTPGTFAELKAMNAEQQSEKKAQIKAAQDREEQEKAFKKPFSEVFPLYMEERKSAVYNPRTYTDELTKGEKWLVPHFGKIAISEIVPADVVAFVKECQAPTKKIKEYGKKEKALPKPRSPQTIKHYLNLLGQVWGWAKEQGHCAGENPARAVSVKKVTPAGDSKRTRFLSKEEADKLMPALKARSVQLWAKCTVMLYCGLRPVEIHALTWGDIDETNQQIKVRREIKTNKGTSRIVPYPGQIHAMLAEIRPEAAQPNDLVFPPKSIRKRVGRDAVHRSFEISDVFEEVINGFGWNNGVAKNDRVVPYTLRHTYASWLVQAGVPLYTVAELIGHSTTEVTSRYAHLAPDNLRSAISIFN